jgi:protein-arginine kinase activator protein McsA
MRESCDLCHSRPAKNHLCEIIDGRQTSLDLCDECFRTRTATTGFQMPSLDGTQRCYYCGGLAQSAGRNHQWEQPVRGQLFHYSCFRCSELSHQFVAAALAALPSGLSREAQLEALTRLIADTDAQVRERVRSQET